MRWIAVICVTLLATISGCAFVDWIFGEPGSYYDEFETPMAFSSGRFSSDNPWIGRHRDELIESLGQPDMILEARPKYSEYRGGIPRISYVYRSEPVESPGRSTCIDAYVVLQATGEIVNYYCR